MPGLDCRVHLLRLQPLIDCYVQWCAVAASVQGSRFVGALAACISGMASLAMPIDQYMVDKKLEMKWGGYFLFMKKKSDRSVTVIDEHSGLVWAVCSPFSGKSKKAERLNERCALLAARGIMLNLDDSLKGGIYSAFSKLDCIKSGVEFLENEFVLGEAFYAWRRLCGAGSSSTAAAAASSGRTCCLTRKHSRSSSSS